MPALIPTRHVGTVAWLGRVARRDAGLVSEPVPALHLAFAGPDGEAHGGLTRRSCSRVVAQYPRGTTIRNSRQLAIVSAQELAEIARRMGLDKLDPSLVGASMVIDGLPDLTHLPPSSRLQADSGASIVVDMQNLPCHLPAKPIDAVAPGFGRRFKAAADGLRGVTGWVECEGRVQLGDRIRLHVPGQRPWRVIP